MFFRDPNRIIGSGIVSPADGRVISITKEGTENKNDLSVEKRERINGKNPEKIRIAIFMNVNNVHVNRAPIPGKIIYMKHIRGRLIPAYKPESKYNERLITIIKSEIGNIKIVQIAGILAKRIVPYVKPGDRLIKGQRIGIIQFGSRVDVILPKGRVEVHVVIDQHIIAGSTTIALIK
jgi:phosphatidylserine decarboxylase